MSLSTSAIVGEGVGGEGGWSSYAFLCIAGTETREEQRLSVTFDRVLTVG